MEGWGFSTQPGKQRVVVLIFISHDELLTSVRVIIRHFTRYLHQSRSKVRSSQEQSVQRVAARKIRQKGQTAMKHFEGEQAAMCPLLQKLNGCLGVFQARSKSHTFGECLKILLQGQNWVCVVSTALVGA